MDDLHLICCSRCYRPWKTGGGCDTVDCDGHVTSVPATQARELELGATADRLHAITNELARERDAG